MWWLIALIAVLASVLLFSQLLDIRPVEAALLGVAFALDTLLGRIVFTVVGLYVVGISILYLESFLSSLLFAKP